MARRAQVVLGLVVLVVFAVASSPSQGAPSAKPPDFDKAAAAVEKHADKWLDKPGVVGVGVGVNKAGKAVVHVYKLKDADEDIPSDVDGVAVEQVQSGRFDKRALPTDRWPRPVPIGVSAGLADFATGTLGARVTDGTHVYALSNNHVFAGIDTASSGDPITQPGPTDGGSDPADRIGTLADYQQIDFNGGDNVMDAAIALTTAGDVGTATPPDGYGAPSTTPAAAAIGMGVQKYGRTTGFQQGTVQDVNFAVDVCYLPLIEDICFPGFEARFVNQIAVTPGTFSAPGDSGSLMVTQGGNQPVALLFAGDGTLTIGNPIVPVLQRFNVTIDGAPPGDGPPGAPTSLVAVGGNASVSLSWNAPSFDGGSSVTGYKLYRGTSAGSETFLADVATTTYVDSDVVNGTTYHYKVSAVNDNGEGPRSAGASALPLAFVTPVEPLAILDNFDRGFENPLNDGGQWFNGVNGGAETGLYVPSVWLACSKSTTCTSWRSGQRGPDTEVYARVGVLPGDSNQFRLYARLQQPGSTGYDGYMLRTNQLAGTDEVLLERIDNDTFVTLKTINQEIAAGDVLLLRVQGTTLEAWRHDGSAWSRLGVVTDATYASAGFTGVGIRGTTGRLDDFGARTMGGGPPASPPGAPIALSAVPGDASVSLSWSAPALDGGSQIASYRVYRGTTPNPTAVVGSPTGTSFSDSGLTNGLTYYYRVSAVNGAGEGPASNEVSATPLGLVPPAAPLPTIDNFDRGFENPLSGGGLWFNGVNGSAETGLYVPSVWLACSKSTTCTSWRNDGQPGPDTEVYARVGVLPGDTNQFRLYARLRQVGSTGYDGYMLRMNQQSGTDQIWLERVDNDTFVTLKTIDQEIAAGDVLLLRVQGTTLEAWRHNGSTWARLGTASDATYQAAGSVGVGIRGTTGRLDDFGARTMGAPPPDTEPPSAPGTLTASVFSDTQIELAWGAATDDVGPISYRIERCSGSGCSNFAEVAAGTSTTHMDVGLAPSTDYSYRVRALDAADNEGPYSNTASATTQAPPDTEPPTAPANLNATATSSTQIDLTWDAATDNVGVTLYRIERCEGAGCSVFTEIAATPGTSYSNTGLSASTSYTYRVRAEDAVPLLGPYSNTAGTTTQAPPDTQAPTAPTSLTATAASSTRIDLSWGAATDNVGVTLYHIERCESPSCGNFVEIATTPTPGFSDTDRSPSTSYTYRVRAQDAVPLLGPYSNLASATTQAPPRPLFFSLLNAGTVGGVAAANEDVVFFDGTAFSLAFDGSDVGLASRRLDAFTWLDADTLLISLDSDGATLPGVTGTIDNSDVVRFDATSLGPTTAGAFSMYFDGSDVGLTTNAEDVDAFELLANGDLLLSTEGSFGVTGVSGADEDLVAFAPASLGATTSGTFTMYFDGSDVGLSASGEDVDAAAVDATGRIHLSTRDNFAVAGATGEDEDVFVFTPTTLGATTAGTYEPSLYFDGSAFGLAGNDVFAIDLPPGA